MRFGNDTGPFSNSPVAVGEWFELNEFFEFVDRQSGVSDNAAKSLPFNPAVARHNDDSIFLCQRRMFPIPLQSETGPHHRADDPPVGKIGRDPAQATSTS